MASDGKLSRTYSHVCVTNARPSTPFGPSRLPVAADEYSVISESSDVPRTRQWAFAVARSTGSVLGAVISFRLMAFRYGVRCAFGRFHGDAYRWSRFGADGYICGDALGIWVRRPCAGRVRKPVCRSSAVAREAANGNRLGGTPRIAPCICPGRTPRAHTGPQGSPVVPVPSMSMSFTCFTFDAIGSAAATARIEAARAL